jgi:hypothetical protein
MIHGRNGKGSRSDADYPDGEERQEVGALAGISQERGADAGTHTDRAAPGSGRDASRAVALKFVFMRGMVSKRRVRYAAIACVSGLSQTEDRGAELKHTGRSMTRVYSPCRTACRRVEPTGRRRRGRVS